MNLRLLALIVILPFAVIINAKGNRESLSQEENIRKYNKFYLEAICQKAMMHYAAEQELLEHALKYNPTAAEAIYELAVLRAQNPLYSEEETDSLFCLALDLDSANNQYRWELARHKLTIGKLDDAVPLLQTLTKDKALRYNAFTFLSTIYERQGKDSVLLRTLQRWETEEGGDESISMGKYRALTRLQRHDEALKLADTLCMNYPQNDYFPILKAESYLNKGDTARALRENEKIISVSPENSYSQLFLVHYYQLSGRKDALVREVEKVIMNSRQDMETRVQFMTNYIKSHKGKDEYKIDSLFSCLLEQPMEEAGLMNLYTSYLAQKNAPDSLFAPIMHKMLEIDPSDRQSRLREVWSLFQKHRYAEAVASCEAGLKYDKTQMLLYILGGNSCMIMDEKEKALKFFEAGRPYVNNTSQKETISDYFSAYADLLHEIGKKEESYAMYDSSLVYNPSNVSTLNNYAYYLSLEGEHLEKAKEMATLAIKYTPDEATYLDTYAWVCFALKDYDNARIYIEKAIKFLSGGRTDSSVYEHAGDIYIQLGLTTEALNSWKKAKELNSDSKVLDQKIKLKKYIAQ